MDFQLFLSLFNHSSTCNLELSDSDGVLQSVWRNKEASFSSAGFELSFSSTHQLASSGCESQYRSVIKSDDTS